MTRVSTRPTPRAETRVERESEPIVDVSGEASGEVSGETRSAADQFMRRLLRVEGVTPTARTEREAHRGFRTSLIVSAVRCLIMYLAVPILVPILGFSGVVAAPVGIALALLAGVNGVYSVRRFWIGNLGSRWMYTWFIAFVFLVLIVGIVVDVSRILGAL